MAPIARRFVASVYVSRLYILAFFFFQHISFASFSPSSYLLFTPSRDAIICSARCISEPASAGSFVSIRGIPFCRRLRGFHVALRLPRLAGLGTREARRQRRVFGTRKTRAL